MTEAPDPVGSGIGRTAVIIGGGPAGLTAAIELLRHTDIHPIVLEADGQVGGISKTVVYKGNRIDIGGHRFFSKSDRVMDWWNEFLPLQAVEEDGTEFALKYQGKSRTVHGSQAGVDPESTDEVMLVRSRLSRIFYLGKFFSYPVKLEGRTIRNLGLPRIAKIGFSYLRARLFPLKEVSLEEFYINRFGRELYNTFFKSYTEKVWGVPVNEIAPDWGAQRVKGLSITKTLAHAVRSLVRRRRSTDVRQKGVETSLIENFLYPKHGPGQMWEVVTRRIAELGGEVRLSTMVTGLQVEDGRVVSVDVLDAATGSTGSIPADFVISSMPVNELVAGLQGIEVPANVSEVASTLPFRDFITVGILLKRLRIENSDGSAVSDNWIYIQEPHVKVGRLQVFNNWSPYLVADDDTVWVGMEYFVYENDELWSLSDDEMAAFGIRELAEINIIDAADVLDSTVFRVKKTYPAYFGSYARFDEVREFTDGVENLFLVGRNGMHRYNNQDHSMLTAMTAVENIAAGRTDSSNIWDVNVEQEYHEEKS